MLTLRSGQEMDRQWNSQQRDSRCVREKIQMAYERVDRNSVSQPWLPRAIIANLQTFLLCSVYMETDKSFLYFLAIQIMVFIILNCVSYRLERHDMFDMIPILFDSTLMIARPTPLDMDFGLLIRPYRREAWIMVGVTVAAIFAFLIVPGFFLPKFSSYTRYA